MSESFLNGRVVLHAGDSRDVLKTIADNSIDSIVTDPPYALVSIVKRFGGKDAAAVKVPEGGSGAYARASSGFMGKQWDTGETAFAVEFWAECLRVLKPGGHVVAFSGTRTYHRMACAIEDAGFEVRDMLQYLYGSGFPKSHSVTRGLGDAVCCCEETPERNLRPVRSPHVSASFDVEDERREVLLAGVSEQGPHGTVLREDPEEGFGRLEKSSLEGRGDIPQAARELRQRPIRSMPAGIDLDGAHRRIRDGASEGDGYLGREAVDSDRMRSPSRPQAAEQSPHEFGDVAGQSKSQAGGAWEDCGGCGKPMVPAGWGTALKPACEPICFGRKPLIGTVAVNVLEHGTGAINIDGCRVEFEDTPNAATNPLYRKQNGYALHTGDDSNSTSWKLKSDRREQPAHSQGRWPANVIHDGSEEVLAAFPADLTSGKPAGMKAGGQGVAFGHFNGGIPVTGFGDTGSAARFFYTAKADADDRLGSKHPTVKPVDLMQWLCRLVTPPGGTVLDPFSGTGTTGEAAFREGFSAVLIEREAEYQDDIRRRMALCMAGPDERARESIKAKIKDQPVDHGPLFAGAAE